MELKLPFLNLVVISGRLVADPHPLKAKDETQGSAFTIASNRYVPQSKKQVATFVDIVVWGDTAAAVNASLVKGSPVIVTGALAQYTRKNGKTETKQLQVSAQQVQFLARKVADDDAPVEA